MMMSYSVAIVRASRTTPDPVSATPHCTTRYKNGPAKLLCYHPLPLRPGHCRCTRPHHSVRSDFENVHHDCQGFRQIMPSEVHRRRADHSRGPHRARRHYFVRQLQRPLRATRVGCARVPRRRVPSAYQCAQSDSHLIALYISIVSVARLMMCDCDLPRRPC